MKKTFSTNSLNSLKRKTIQMHEYMQEVRDHMSTSQGLGPQTKRTPAATVPTSSAAAQQPAKKDNSHTSAAHSYSRIMQATNRDR